MKRWLYKVQQWVAITETEARALGVVLLLLGMGTGARWGFQQWGAPEPAEPRFIVPAAPSLGVATSDTVVAPMARDTAIAANVAAPEGQMQRGPRTPRPPGPVNVNTATSAELQRLPGIGPAMASRIIEHRTQNGPFRTVADLLAVKGIGKKTLEKLAPLVTVGE